MLQTATAWCGQVPGPRSDDNHPPVPSGQQDSLQVGYSGGEGHLMDDDYLPHHVVDVVIQLLYGQELAFGIGSAEAGIVQAINNHWGVVRQTLTVPNHLRQDCCHGVGRAVTASVELSRQNSID